jgi:homoserine O-acetyltransferase/O-succinyltransferase
MHNLKNKILFIIGFGLFPLFIYAQSVQKFAGIGDFTLESGKVIKDCNIGYRTFGKLNADHSNIILYLMWFGGHTKDIEELTAPGKTADSTKFYLVAIDPLGNGISSSPSNSKQQPNDSFPVFNIRDMVATEYLLVTKMLHLTHVYCVMGGSMGGMQTFEWITAHPGFMDKAVITVGSPKLTSNDLLLWTAELLAINEGLKCCMPEESIKNVVAAIHDLNLQTPDYFVENVPPEEFPKRLKYIEDAYTEVFNSHNWKSQIQAMMQHNVSFNFNNDMKKAAGVVKAKVCMILSTQDHMVNPHPAMDFSKLINAETLILNNNYGHYGADCEAEKVNKVITEFLNSKINN